MILSLILLGLLVAIAIRVAVQGFFGALVMAVLTVVCAATALGTHEYVTNQWLAGWLNGWNSDYAFPISLILLFGVPLLVLRLIFDRLFRRACLLSALMDKVGAGLAAVVTAMVMVGLLAIALQMIPFTNGSILGWSRIDVAKVSAQPDPTARPPEEGERGLCFGLNPDRFTAGLVSVLSSGVLSGGTEFYLHHPGYVRELGWVNSVHAEVSRLAPPNSISVVRTRIVDYVYTYTPGNERTSEPPKFEPQSPSGGQVFRMIRLNLRAEARDVRKSHTFGLRQIRLVGRERGDLRQYHPIAVQQSEINDPVNRHIRFEKRTGNLWPVTDERWSPREDNGNEIEVVFELPPTFEPLFIEYKREARVAVSFTETGGETVAEERPARPAGAETTAEAGTPASGQGSPTTPGTPEGEASGGRSGRRRITPSDDGAAGRGDRARVQTVGTTGGSSFSDELPIAVRAYQQIGDTQIQGDRMVQGHLVAVVSEQEGGVNRAVTKFAVPEGKRLLQLSTVRLQARSTLGRALSQAVGTMQNFIVTDSNGKQYPLAGKYAIASARGGQVFEVQFFGEPTGSIGGLGPFNRINEGNLSADDTYVLLFLVDPGARIVRFNSGSAASRSDDLTAENLVAPQ